MTERNREAKTNSITQRIKKDFSVLRNLFPVSNHSDVQIDDDNQNRFFFSFFRHSILAEGFSDSAFSCDLGRVLNGSFRSHFPLFLINSIFAGKVNRAEITGSRSNCCFDNANFAIDSMSSRLQAIVDPNEGEIDY
jgi:hypothetical protein